MWEPWLWQSCLCRVIISACSIRPPTHPVPHPDKLHQKLACWYHAELRVQIHQGLYLKLFKPTVKLHGGHLFCQLINESQLPTILDILGEYVMALKQAPRDPLISLCIGMTFIHMASQKFASRRHSLVIQVKWNLKKLLQILINTKLWNN